MERKKKQLFVYFDRISWCREIIVQLFCTIIEIVDCKVPHQNNEMFSAQRKQWRFAYDFLLFLNSILIIFCPKEESMLFNEMRNSHKFAQYRTAHGVYFFLLLFVIFKCSPLFSPGTKHSVSLNFAHTMGHSANL